ncbi:hypothetical protein [Sphingobacterium multivorum]|uniref:hypothetical protein n=1 Tax=Sphingobacterium multivorum TaxID=28454 RepID=UPI00345E3EAC
MTSGKIKRKISLPQSELFKNDVAIDLDGIYLDLHNDYDCVRLAYNEAFGEFRLNFKRIDLETDLNYDLVELVFIDTVMDTCLLVFDEGFFADIKTIDLLYRGRFEKGNELAEFDSSGRSLYYISFYGGLELKVFAKALEVEL